MEPSNFSIDDIQHILLTGDSLKIGVLDPRSGSKINTSGSKAKHKHSRKQGSKRQTIVANSSSPPTD